MSLLNRFHLFNQDKEKVAVVVPYGTKGTFFVQGYNTHILRHISKEMTKEELQAFKEQNNLLHEEELGQLSLDMFL